MLTPSRLVSSLLLLAATIPAVSAAAPQNGAVVFFDGFEGRPGVIPQEQLPSRRFALFNSFDMWRRARHPDPSITSSTCPIEVQNNIAGSPAPIVGGEQYIELMSSCAANVYTDIPTIPGAVYKLEFLFAQRATERENHIKVFWGSPVAALKSVQNPEYLDLNPPPQTRPLPANPWQTQTVLNLPSAGTTTRLSFVGWNSFSQQRTGAYVDNVKLTLVSGGRGDPQFIGFLGQSYQVHGTSDTVYNILSTPSLQYNAHFQYLEQGKCRKGTQCFSHPGNYFGKVGLSLKDESGMIRDVVIESGDVETGLSVHYGNNNATLSSASPRLTIGSYAIELANQYEVRVESDEFNLLISNSDHFLNQDVSIGAGLMKKIAAYKQAVKQGDEVAAEQLLHQLPHGILGQTWQSKTYNNRWKHIEGQLFDYIVTDGVFGREFKYNKF